MEVLTPSPHLTTNSGSLNMSWSPYRCPYIGCSLRVGTESDSVVFSRSSSTEPFFYLTVNSIKSVSVPVKVNYMSIGPDGYMTGVLFSERYRKRVGHSFSGSCV